eukprot:tig00020909_g15336.t1
MTGLVSALTMAPPPSPQLESWRTMEFESYEAMASHSPLWESAQHSSPWVRGPETALPDDLAVPGLARALDDALELAARRGADAEIGNTHPIVYIFSVHKTEEYAERARMWLKTLRNSIRSMEQIHMGAPALVVTTNEFVCEGVKDTSVSCFVDRSRAEEGGRWLEQLNLKLLYLLNAAALGADAVLVDADVVFVRDPTHLFARRAFGLEARPPARPPARPWPDPAHLSMAEASSIAPPPAPPPPLPASGLPLRIRRPRAELGPPAQVQTEGFLGTKRIPGQAFEEAFEEVNAGFVYARSDPDTVRFLVEAYRARWPACTVQCALNRFMRELSPRIDEGARVLTFPRHNVAVHLLPTLLFPAGMEFFWVRAPLRAGLRPYVVHANWAVREEKVHVLRDFGLWFVDPESYWRGRFLMYEPPGDTATFRDEIDALSRALALSAVARRTLVLPRFRCRHMGPELHALFAVGEEWCSAYYFLQVQLLQDAFSIRESSFFGRMPRHVGLTFAQAHIGRQNEGSIQRVLRETEGYDVLQLGQLQGTFYFESAAELQRVAGLLPAAVTCCPTLTAALRVLNLTEAWPFTTGCHERASGRGFSCA